MSYSPFAFQKALVATHATPFLYNTTTEKSYNLGAAQVGIIDPQTGSLVNFNATTHAKYSEYPLIYIGQGSTFASDKLGNNPGHGGYQSSVKTKGINPKNVTKIYKVLPAAPIQSVKDICVDSCSLYCGSTYRLRVDVKGSPALRFLKHNLYRVVDAYTGCCDDPTTPNTVDPNVVLLQWKDQLNSYPTTTSFVNAKVWNQIDTVTIHATTLDSTTIAVSNADAAKLTAGSVNMLKGVGMGVKAMVVTIGADDSHATGYANVVLSVAATATLATGTLGVYEEIATDTYVAKTVANDIANVVSCLELTGAYVSTHFGDCSFSVKDFFEQDPVYLFASIQDITGDACAANCFSVSDVQLAVKGKGFGETAARRVILSNRYRQENWKDDQRLREVLGINVLDYVSRAASAYFGSYFIQHHVPMHANPSSTNDAQQYLYEIIVPSALMSGTGAGKFTAWIEAWLADAGNVLTFTEEYDLPTTL